MFGETNIEKNSDKVKWMYSGYVIAFGEAGSWFFGNGLARNVVSFDVGSL